MSSENEMKLTRRKILASAGAVGVAGAAAGMGTSALFSDTESFEQNTIAAGELDLKMDWEEHYSFPQIYDEFDTDPEEEYETTRDNPADDDSLNEENWTGLPDPSDPVIWVKGNPRDTGNFEDYFSSTVIEAFPDSKGDPVEADFQAKAPCDVLADVPSDYDAFATDSSVGRTKNSDTFDGNDGLPLINLTDVKPGDFGEVTFSAHLCGNDGYLWLQMPGGLDNDENSVTEPEADAESDMQADLDNPNTEPKPNDDIDGEGELAQNVQTSLWYDDDCSNTMDGEPQPLIAMALIDVSDSLDATDMGQIATASNKFVEDLYDAAEVPVEAGVMTFQGVDPDPGSDQFPIILQNDLERLEPGSSYLTNDADPDGKFDPGNNLLPESGDGDTPIAPALDLAREVLNDRAEDLISTSGNGFGPNSHKALLVMTDGEPTSPRRERYGLVDPDGNDVKDLDYDKTDSNPETGVTNADDGQFLSDVFDGTVDLNAGAANPVKDEAVLVARDIDTGGKTDEQASSVSDDKDISGSNGITIHTVGFGTDQQSAPKTFVTRVATDELWHIASGPGDLTSIINEIVSKLRVTGPAENVIHRGTLVELAEKLDPDVQGPGQDSAGPIMLDGNKLETSTSDPQKCFDSGTVHCFGLSWWVPEDVGNEIQSDSVGFDLGFYAEQCRNNDNPTGP